MLSKSFKMMRKIIILGISVVFVATLNENLHNLYNNPSFLSKVDGRAVKEFRHILNDKNSTISEIEQSLENWSKDNSVEKEFSEYVEKAKKKREEMNRNIDEVLENLKIVKDKYHTISDNKDQTFMELKSALKELWKEYPKESSILFMLSRPEKTKKQNSKHGNNNRKIKLA